MSAIIDLTPHEDRDVSIDGTRVSITGPQSTVVYSLPRGAKRIVLRRATKDRTELTLGGFKATTVVLSGPHATMRTLFDAVTA